MTLTFRPAVLALCSMCIAKPASATQLLFQGASSGIFTSYTESGFNVSVLSGSFDVSQRPLEYYGSGPRLMPAVPEGTVVGELGTAPTTESALGIVAVDGDLFTFGGDLGAHAGYENARVTITGYAGSAVAYRISGDPSGHGNYVAVLNLMYSETAITALTYTFDNPSYLPDSPGLLTDIEVTPVAATPESSSLVLLLTGAVALWGAGLRRVRACQGPLALVSAHTGISSATSL